jgi:hypothetical protein
MAETTGRNRCEPRAAGFVRAAMRASALYLRKYEPPKVIDSDYEFDRFSAAERLTSRPTKAAARLFSA